MAAALAVECETRDARVRLHPRAVGGSAKEAGTWQ